MFVYIFSLYSDKTYSNSTANKRNKRRKNDSQSQSQKQHLCVAHKTDSNKDGVLHSCNLVL